MHATANTRRRPANFSYKAIPCLLILTAALFSCRKSTPAPDVTRTLDLPAGSARIISAGNQFAMNFFNTVLQQDTVTPNPLISPLAFTWRLACSTTAPKAPPATQ